MISRPHGCGKRGDQRGPPTGACLYNAQPETDRRPGEFMSQPTLPFDHFNLVHPDHYAEYGYPHEIWTWLRANAPVYRWEQEGDALDYWVISKHADIQQISTHPKQWLNGPRLTLSHEPEERMDMFPATLIQMDAERHRVFRKMISHRFKPQALARHHGDIEQIGKEIVDKLVLERDSGECDFVKEVAAPLPIAVIAWLLGLPKEDWNLLFDWTNRIIGASDPEFQEEGKDPRESAQATMIELFTYFTKLVEEKRKNPADDLVTLFTQLELDGKPLDPMDVMAWCLIIVVAGNETTRNGTSGGMLAFVENPGEISKLQRDPSLLAGAVEEAVRWSTPIIHFARTAVEDCEIRGQKISAGEAVGLFYPSANRDEDVFDDPFSFRIDRQPNRHMGFGIGEHFCLGVHLARLEMTIAYKHLLPRIEEIELTGPVSRLHSSLVGGVKHLPIRYKLKPA
jgi:cholest-4-en-3-one 26-monooxygenase